MLDKLQNKTPQCWEDETLTYLSVESEEPSCVGLEGESWNVTGYVASAYIVHVIE